MLAYSLLIVTLRFIQTPCHATLARIADGASDLAEVRALVAAWAEHLTGLADRPRLMATIHDAPRLLAQAMDDGEVADAWLAACAELLATTLGRPPPPWATEPRRTLATPWPRGTTPPRDSPPAFVQRGLYLPAPTLSIHLRRGRPPVPPEQRRRVDAERQRRYRLRRAAELARLRAAGSNRRTDPLILPDPAPPPDDFVVDLGPLL